MMNELTLAEVISKRRKDQSDQSMCGWTDKSRVTKRM